jgi:hypothetical protein
LRQILCLVSAAALVWAGDGRTPRSSASDYPAHQDAKNATIAAVRVPDEQLNHIFPSDLSKKYVVVEVAIYPKDGSSVEVAAVDFVLRLTDSESHPETAEEVAAMWRPHSKAHPDITSKTHVYTETGVIIAHGQDPVTGRPTTRTGTYEQVGVANGEDPNRRAPYPSGSSGVDADRFEAMLGNWALPEGKAASPVAGYLYFPLPKATKGKGKAIELQYAHEGSSATLTLPALSK